jgi:hypothetical protein
VAIPAKPEPIIIEWFNDLFGMFKQIP